MGKNLQNEVEYYYDSHPTEEDLMGETSIHAELVHYLKEVLTWLFHGQRCAIYENLNFYRTSNRKEYPIAPDLAVIKEVDYRRVRSWKIGRSGPAPHVVFEIASEETWKKDLGEKPALYAQMGVQEYFFSDPDEVVNWGRQPRRKLLGWQLNPAMGGMEAMEADGAGRLWSSQLESFLVPEGEDLRLYDSQQQRRLTEAEALAGEREVLAQKLRSLGVNPDEI